METRTSRLHLPSSSRSRSPISDNEKRSISISPRRGPSTPNTSSLQRNNSHDEHEHLPLNDNTKAILDETSPTMISDTDQNHHKKRSHHRHHHRHHKQPKSNKRSAPQHKHSVKRSKKETVSTTRHNKSNDENSMSSSEKNTSESEQSPSEKEIISSDNESNDEEGIVEGNSTPSERRSRRHHKKHRSSSSLNDRNSQSPSSSPSGIPKNNRGTQLIVNYLPASLRESDFYQLFVRIAPIKLCKLITDRHTGHSYCYGFIEYHSKEDAIKAIEKYNGYRIEHKKLKVSYAQPKSNQNDEIDNDKHINYSIQKNANIYITDLPDDFDEKMLERLFSKYGQIIKTKVLRDPRTRISRGVAFVLMKSTRYAERAVKALDGYVPSGSHIPISVKYADLKKTVTTTTTTTTTPANSSSNNNSSSRLPNPASIGPYGYPPGLPPLGMIDPYYAAAALHHHHRAAMNMRELSPSPPLPSYYSSGNSRSSRTRGLSPGLPRSYSSSSSKHNSNILPTTTMNNSTSSSRSLNINSSLPSGLNNSSTLAAAYDLIAKGCQQAIDPNGFVIYAFGLPHDCDENDLEELFQRYGDVYRVYIVRNYTTGESKGYSFVTMRKYEDACHAVDRLDGTTFQGRTIQVRFKQ